MQQLEKLNTVLKHIKDLFVGKNDVIDLLAICLIARENAFLYGPPGTAKSAIVRNLSQSISGGQNFEYLFTRFTEPNEIFGPFDIRKLREGELQTNTDGMLPEASIAFLDEIFNANSAILNSLLTALNEKIFKRGKELKKLPTLMFVGASNIIPDDDALKALFDRFLVRILVENVPQDLLHQVLISGRKLENNENLSQPEIGIEDILELQSAAKKINLKPIYEKYIHCIFNLRNAGISISDRRAVKLQNLISASALLCNREEAIISDLWVLKHIWDTEEQIEVLEGIINSIIEKDDTPNQHPQARNNKSPNPEELMKDVQALVEKWEIGNLSLEEQNVVKDKLRYLQTRCDWIHNVEKKEYIQKEIQNLWENILHTI